MGAVERFGFIGGGNMGEALIKGLLQSGRAQPQDIIVFDVMPDRQKHLLEKYEIFPADNNSAVIEEATIIVLAVKPQNMDNVLGEIGPLVTSEQILVSIAAGVTLGKLEQYIRSEAPVIRVMPNTPALALAGAAALAPGTHATKEDMAKAMRIFEAVGVAVDVEEKYMDIVTGLSGSGPAYVFVLLEALTDGAVRLGLPRNQAQLLASQTILGAAKLAQETGVHPGQLKDMVTSPGGTTAAGLHALEKGGFRSLIMDAVAAAANRSAELGSE